MDINKRIEELEESIFYLHMKDRWNNQDYLMMNRMQIELNELKKKVEEK